MILINLQTPDLGKHSIQKITINDMLKFFEALQPKIIYRLFWVQFNIQNNLLQPF